MHSTSDGTKNSRRYIFRIILFTLFNDGFAIIITISGAITIISYTNCSIFLSIIVIVSDVKEDLTMLVILVVFVIIIMISESVV